MATADRQPARLKLEVFLAVIVIGGVLWLVFARVSEPRATREPQAPRSNPGVQRIMRAYNELADKYLMKNPETSPSRYAAAMGELCDILQRQDKSDCPADFQVACAQNIRAIRDAKAVLERMPDGAVEGAAMGAVNYLLRGEADGGLIRLHGEIEQALKRIRSTSDEVERIAAKYTE